MRHLVGHVAAALLAIIVVFTASIVRADPTYPAFSAPVVDAANVLSAADKAAITQKLVDLQTKTGVQFAVATVPSLQGLEIEPYANALFRSWKLGQKGVNNGLLLLVAPTEHKFRFEVGYGLEGTMTDVQSRLIQNNTMKPKLKAGDTAGAIKAGTDDAILVLTQDKAGLPDRLKPAAQTDASESAIVWFVVLLIIFVVVISMIRRRGGGGDGGFLSGWTTGAFIGSGTGGGMSGGDTSGGDTFSGGGGGDSGGGGSSDSW